MGGIPGYIPPTKGGIWEAYQGIYTREAYMEGLTRVYTPGRHIWKVYPVIYPREAIYRRYTRVIHTREAREASQDPKDG